MVGLTGGRCEPPELSLQQNQHGREKGRVRSNNRPSMHGMLALLGCERPATSVQAGTHPRSNIASTPSNGTPPP